MPKIKPTGGEVSWPEDEGVLGIIGVAPWATIEFLNSFYALVHATKDWHYPRVITDINTKLPSRGRYFQLGERDPSPFIAESIIELRSLGATAIVVPCNTAHLLYDRWAADAGIPVPHIVEETVAEAVSAGARTATSFTSTSLANFDLYGKSIEKAGVACHRLQEEEQKLISSLLEEVKVHGSVLSTSLERLDILAESLRKASVDSVLLGCTELSGIAERLKQKGFLVVDSNAALARASLNLIIGKRASSQNAAA